jgi:geranylgeranyl diphosphate synthase, type I
MLENRDKPGIRRPVVWLLSEQEDRIGRADRLMQQCLWGDPALTGKPVYSDLHSRKKSLPVVAALTSSTPAGRELAALYHRDQSLSGSDLVRAAELIDVAGGRAWSQTQADELLTQAMRDLTSANPTARAAQELAALARLATHRDH